MKKTEKLKAEILDTERRINGCVKEIESQELMKLQYESWKRALEWALEDED